MKKILTLVLVFSFINLTKSQIAAWNFNATTSAALDATTTSPNLTISAISFGTGLTGTGNQIAGSSCGAAYTSSGYTTAFTLDDYWEFTLTPINGRTVNVASITFSARASSNINSYAVRYSVDSYNSNLATASPGVFACASSVIASVSMTSQTSAVTFRVYFWGASTVSGNTLRIDDLSVTGNVVLGVELKDIIISKNNTSTKLTWQTATEQNNSHFSVERSQDGFAFDKIGEVKGAGTSTKAKDYNFVDNAPVKGTNYYQLRQVDFDGKETISKTVAVNFDGKVGKAKVYPTVVKVMLTVELASDAATDISVRDVTGRVVLSKNTEGAFSTTLDLGTAANGLYFITVQSNQGLETMKVLKQ